MIFCEKQLAQEYVKYWKTVKKEQRIMVSNRAMLYFDTQVLSLWFDTFLNLTLLLTCRSMCTSFYEIPNIKLSFARGENYLPLITYKILVLGIIHTSQDTSFDQGNNRISEGRVAQKHDCGKPSFTYTTSVVILIYLKLKTVRFFFLFYKSLAGHLSVTFLQWLFLSWSLSRKFLR